MSGTSADISKGRHQTSSSSTSRRQVSRPAFTAFSVRPRSDGRTDAAATSSSYYLCNDIIITYRRYNITCITYACVMYNYRARTTLRVEAQQCSGQAVSGLPPAAPVQELQPGTPVTTSPERLGGVFASKAQASYLAKALSTVNSKHRGVTDEPGGTQGAGCLRQHQGLAGTACHVGTAQLREATVRAPSSVARAFGIHSQRP